MSPTAKTLLLACLAAPLAVQAGICSRQSPAHTVALLELYTSEGCSSCPPADRWLRELSSRFSAEQLVALALHVDYWDYIGWQDPFAQAQFGERQRRLAGGATIYTPEVFVGLRELRAWSDAPAFERRLREINRQPARADIRLGMRPGAGDTLEAEALFTINAGERGRAGLQGVLVLYEDRLVSRVRHGENRGVTLAHDHVVRYWSPPFPLQAGGTPQTVHRTLPIGAGWERTKLGLAALVQDVRTGEVLQVVALPACVSTAG